MPKKELANEAKLWVKDNFPSVGKFLWPSLKSLEKVHGTQALEELLSQKSIHAGGDLEAIFAGHARVPRVGAGNRSYIFQQGQRSIDPMRTGAQPQVINIEAGNRMWKFPQEGFILNTVFAPNCGVKGATGPCGPASLWSSVHKGDKPIEQILIDLKSHHANMFEGLLSDFQAGTPMPTFHDYLIAHDFQRHFPENQEFDLSGGLLGLYPQIEQGVLHIQVGRNGASHLLGVQDGLPVDLGRALAWGANAERVPNYMRVLDIYTAPPNPVDWRSPDPHARPSLHVTHMFEEDFKEDIWTHPENTISEYDMPDHAKWRPAYGKADQK